MENNTENTFQAHIDLVGMEIAAALKVKGWRLYAFGFAGVEGSFDNMESLLNLRQFVEAGPTDIAVPGESYLLLPATSAPTNPDSVLVAAWKLLQQGRGPFFIDVEKVAENGEGGVQLKPIGIYLIDKLVWNPESWEVELHLDQRLSRLETPGNSPSGNVLCFSTTEFPKKARQIMKATRRYIV